MTTLYHDDPAINDAIRQSIKQDEIVILKTPYESDRWPEMVDALRKIADDHVTISSGDNRIHERVRLVFEAWGTADDGDDWRVHVYATQ